MLKALSALFLLPPAASDRALKMADRAAEASRAVQEAARRRNGAVDSLEATMADLAQEMGHRCVSR